MSKHDIKVIVAALVVVFAFVMQSWRSRYYDYQCRKCGGRFNLPVWKAVLSVHAMGNKFIKCPKCRKWYWVNRKLKE